MNLVADLKKCVMTDRDLTPISTNLGRGLMTILCLKRRNAF